MATAGLTDVHVGRFRLVKQLGRGSTGVVFLATRVGAAGREVALKVVDSDLASQPGFGERLEDEIRRISALSHPSILPVYEYGTAGELTYLVMPVAAGGSLGERLKTGALPSGYAWQVFRPVADALQSAHQAGLIHGDVKPGNILFDSYGRVLLADFGLARTHLGFARGTPGYMAPEQARGQAPDPRADLYSLAVVLFEMLTGSRPYRYATDADLLRATAGSPVPSARERWREVPVGLDAALYRALAKRPAQRYQTMLELIWALGQVLDPRPRRVRYWRSPSWSELEKAANVRSALRGHGAGGKGGPAGLKQFEPGA
jgi:serine/threonine-protein kinase